MRVVVRKGGARDKNVLADRRLPGEGWKVRRGAAILDPRCNTGLLDSAVISKVLVSPLPDVFSGTAGASVTEGRSSRGPEEVEDITSCL